MLQAMSVYLYYTDLAIVVFHFPFTSVKQNDRYTSTTLSFSVSFKRAMIYYCQYGVSFYILGV